MVRDLPAARALCTVDNAAAQLLTSVERPIVLLPKLSAAIDHGQAARHGLGQRLASLRSARRGLPPRWRPTIRSWA